MATTKSWIAISDSTLPKMSKGSPVSELSAQLLIRLKDGSTLPGYCHRYAVDVNARHIQAKKGDYHFVDMAGNKIDAPVSYYPVAKIDDLFKAEQKPEPVNKVEASHKSAIAAPK